MSRPTPTVSVSLVTYNHERYIAAAIRSVLDQNFADLELVIVDDGSSDATAQIIGSFDDPRLIAIRQENQGPGAATNRALAACRGKYVALMSGDDVCHPDRLRKQLAAYERGGRQVLFADVTFIDEEGAPASTGHCYEGVFDACPRTQAEIYHRFFFGGNFLNGITAFTERNLLGENPYDPVLYQLQDFDLWIRLAKRYRITFLPEPVVSYRVRSGHGNLSSPQVGHEIRLNNEYLFLMRRFFEDVPLDLFHAAFARELRRRDCFSVEEIACEQAFLFLRAPHPMQQVVGLEALYGLLRNVDTAAVLRDRYEFTYLNFVTLLKECDVLGVCPRSTSTLYVDTGEGFNQREIREQTVSCLASGFNVRFDLTVFPRVRGLRWDPVELRLCQVELRRITWQDSAGNSHVLDPSRVRSNAVTVDCGRHIFETHDPMFFLPLDGEAASLTLAGCWEFQDVQRTCARMGLLYDRSHQRTSALAEEIRTRDRRIGELEMEIKRMRQSRMWRWLAPVRLVAGGVKTGLRTIRRAG